jgi:RNA polymerase sigma-70 factor (ECF subfamily)
LYRLAVNHVIDHQRRTRRHRHQEQLPETLYDPRGGASDALEQRERRDLIRSALLTLKPHFRDALFLVYIEGMKVDQAARLLGLPSGTIKTRLMRGREALRRALLTRHPEHFGGAS